MYHIVGSSSSIGCYLANRFANETVAVGYCRKKRNDIKLGINNYVLESYLEIDEARVAKGDIVVYCAGTGSVGQSEKNRDQCLEEQYATPLRLSKVCNAIGATFVTLSSAAVYGEVGVGKKINDTTVCTPISYYGECKLRLDEELMKDSSSVILRLMSTYGPYQKKLLIYEVMEQIKHKRFMYRPKIILRGSPDSTRDFIHHEAIYSAVANIKADGDNKGLNIIASGKSFSIQEVVKLCLERTGNAGRFKIDFLKEDSEINPSYWSVERKNISKLVKDPEKFSIPYRLIEVQC